MQRIVALVIVLLGSTPPHSQAAITIKFSIIDSGGGAASSGPLRVSATLGQPLVGVSSGATLALVAGLPPSVAGIAVGAPQPLLPAFTRLALVLPNPFATKASIAFDIASSSVTTVRIFDASGRLIRTLVDGPLEPGRYTIEWDGAGVHGLPVGAGVYFCLLRSGATSEMRRMTLIR